LPTIPTNARHHAGRGTFRRAPYVTGKQACHFWLSEAETRSLRSPAKTDRTFSGSVRPSPKNWKPANLYLRFALPAGRCRRNGRM
jgi:hypothetical protein